jgi:acetyltransferase-like isoleucine patch superfamily enzyme
MAYLTLTELDKLNFKSIGQNVKISKKASIYNSENISIGDHVRIDDFCIISAGKGGIELGNYIHIGAYSMLAGQGNIRMDDFSGLSARVNIYSSTDDYSGNFMTNPTVPAAYTGVVHGDVHLKKHVIVGCGAVILPGVCLGEAAAIGAMSLVNRDCNPLGIYMGNPARQIQTRADKLFQLEDMLKKEH